MTDKLLSAIKSIIYKCENFGINSVKNGSVFIAPIFGGNSAWLHYLYPPCDDIEIDILSDAFGFTVSKELESILRFSNGASLFELTIIINGISGGRFTRSLADEDLAAPSAEEAISVFRVLNEEDWEGGWRPVGEALAINRYYIQVHESGKARLRDSNHVGRSWASLTDMLNSILSSFDDNFNCSGVVDRSYKTLEEELSILLRGLQC
jgi:hypothetical protein